MKEKCAEYEKLLFLALVDYEKAFNSVESKGIDKGYIDAPAEIQNGASTFAMLHTESNPVLICKDER